MTDVDSLQKFIFEHANIRGEIVHLNKTYLSIINQRPYPAVIKQLLGEAIVSCLLLASSIKFDGNLSLQFKGNNHLSLLIVQCDQDLNVRAFAKYEENLEVEYYANAFLEGTMALIISQNNQLQTYQTLVPIKSISMSENLMEYFAQSEQIGTAIWLAINEYAAAGMLLQIMPGENTQERENFWEYAVKIGETLTEQELLQLDNHSLLHRLYHETELRLFEARSTRFVCLCNKEKIEQVLLILGKADAEELIEEQGTVTINCDFCNKEYRFDAIDVTLLFRKRL